MRDREEHLNDNELIGVEDISNSEDEEQGFRCEAFVAVTVIKEPMEMALDEEQDAPGESYPVLLNCVDGDAAAAFILTDGFE